MNPSPTLPLRRGGIINREGAKETGQVIFPQLPLASLIFPPLQRGGHRGEMNPSLK